MNIPEVYAILLYLPVTPSGRAFARFEMRYFISRLGFTLSPTLSLTDILSNHWAHHQILQHTYCIEMQGSKGSLYYSWCSRIKTISVRETTGNVRRLHNKMIVVLCVFQVQLWTCDFKVQPSRWNGFICLKSWHCLAQIGKVYWRKPVLFIVGTR